MRKNRRPIGWRGARIGLRSQTVRALPRRRPLTGTGWATPPSTPPWPASSSTWASCANPTAASPGSSPRRTTRSARKGRW